MRLNLSKLTFKVGYRRYARTPPPHSHGFYSTFCNKPTWSNNNSEAKLRNATVRCRLLRCQIYSFFYSHHMKFYPLSRISNSKDPKYLQYFFLISQLFMHSSTESHYYFFFFFIYINIVQVDLPSLLRHRLLYPL